MEAGKNFDGLSSLQIDDLVSTEKNISDSNGGFPSEEYYSYFLPRSFDAREAWRNCTSIGKIYDQTKGYPSWIYTAVGVIADRLCIKNGIKIDVETTVEKISKCSGYSKGHNSASIGQALEYWSKNGIFTVEPVKDDSTGCLPFSQECQPHKMKIDRYFKVSNRVIPPITNFLRDVMVNGPISAYVEVKSDLPSYKSGVYTRISKKSLGVQNMKIIGWGTEKDAKYLLASNSWGTDWGENGFVKIQRVNALFGQVPNAVSTVIESVDIETDIPKSYNHEQLFYLAK